MLAKLTHKQGPYSIFLIVIGLLQGPTLRIWATNEEFSLNVPPPSMLRQSSVAWSSRDYYSRRRQLRLGQPGQRVPARQSSDPDHCRGLLENAPVRSSDMSSGTFSRVVSCHFLPPRCETFAVDSTCRARPGFTSAAADRAER